jgi:outer membrane protein, multidrug efflux system
MREAGRRLVAVLLAAGVAGCSMAPALQRPVAPVAAAFPSDGRPETGDVAAPALGWRSFFKDPRLQGLIALALANNRDLRIAVARIEEARGQFRVRRADRLPTLAVQGSAERRRCCSGRR